MPLCPSALNLDPAFPCSSSRPITRHYVNGDSVKMDLPRSIEPPDGPGSERRLQPGVQEAPRGKGDREHLAPHCPVCSLCSSLAEVLLTCSSFRFQLGCHLLWEAFPDCCPPGWSAFRFVDAPSLGSNGPLISLPHQHEGSVRAGAAFELLYPQHGPGIRSAPNQVLLNSSLNQWMNEAQVSFVFL